MDFGIQISKDEAAEIQQACSKDGGQSVCFELFLNNFKVSFSLEMVINLVERSNCLFPFYRPHAAQPAKRP